jgi:hypothetical protein
MNIRDIKTKYNNEFDRYINFDYINQLIPVIFKVTGREILDVSLQPGTSPITAFPPQLTPLPGVFGTHVVPHPILNSTSGTVTITPNPSSSKAQVRDNLPVNITFSNYGDVTLHNLVAKLSTTVNALTTAAATAQTYPLGIVGPSIFHLFTLPAYSHRTVTTNITTALGCAAIEPIMVASTYTNAIGQRVSFADTVTLQIQQNAYNYNPAVCPIPAPAAVPGTGASLLPRFEASVTGPATVARPGLFPGR